jgi:hypothetical protein
MNRLAMAACAMLVATCVAPSAAAQQPAAANTDREIASPEEVKKEQEAKKADSALADRDFAGFQLGVGLSLTLDSGERDRITDAQVINGIVRVTNQDNAVARMMFETHYFFTPRQCLLGLGSDKPGAKGCSLLAPDQWGWGPFIAVQPGEKEIIDAIGLGLMIGFRRPQRSDSFNMGIGAIVNPNVRVLGDGIEPNRPLPTGETEIRFKEQEQWGTIFITSYTF